MGQGYGWATMDALIAELGEEGVLRMVCTRIAEGEDPRDIARNNGMPWLVMRKWMEDNDVRMKDWGLAKRCFADGLMWEGLKEVKDAGIEEVSLAKLRADTYHKVAGKMSRDEWGDKQQLEVTQTHSVDIKSLLELREARLGAAVIERLPVVVEGEVKREAVVSDE